MGIENGLILAALIITSCFTIGLWSGPPYVPTLTPQVKIALDMIDLQKDQTLLELGCGDGKVLLAAARRGWRAVGYEINPLLWLVAWLRTRRYGRQVKVKLGSFWNERRWDSQADGIFVFIMPRHMPRLNDKINAWRQLNKDKPVRLVSFAFKMPGKRLIASDKLGVYLYDYRK